MPSVAETELLQRRAKVKELLAQKDELEQEIKLHHQSLEAVGVGMDAPLVDRCVIITNSGLLPLALLADSGLDNNNLQ
jgi:hypothetical protein